MIHRIEKYTKTGSAHTYTLTFTRYMGHKELLSCDLDFTSGRTHTFTQYGLSLSAGESIILILLAEGYTKQETRESILARADRMEKGASRRGYSGVKDREEAAKLREKADELWPLPQLPAKTERPFIPRNPQRK